MSSLSFKESFGLNEFIKVQMMFALIDPYNLFETLDRFNLKLTDLKSKKHGDLLVENFIFYSDRSNLSEGKIKEILEKYDYNTLIREYGL